MVLPPVLALPMESFLSTSDPLQGHANQAGEVPAAVTPAPDHANTMGEATQPERFRLSFQAPLSQSELGPRQRHRSSSLSIVDEPGGSLKSPLLQSARKRQRCDEQLQAARPPPLSRGATVTDDPLSYGPGVRCAEAWLDTLGPRPLTIPGFTPVRASGRCSFFQTRTYKGAGGAPLSPSEHVRRCSGMPFPLAEGAGLQCRGGF